MEIFLGRDPEPEVEPEPERQLLGTHSDGTPCYDDDRICY